MAQDRFAVEVFTRQDDDRWLLSAFNDPEDEAVFDSIDCNAPLRRIYDKVGFELSDGGLREPAV